MKLFGCLQEKEWRKGSYICEKSYTQHKPQSTSYLVFILVPPLNNM